jgi:hypothetical protein
MLILVYREILLRSEIIRALRFVRFDGLKIEGTRWKELKLWAKIKKYMGPELASN